MAKRMRIWQKRNSWARGRQRTPVQSPISLQRKDLSSPGEKASQLRKRYYPTLMLIKACFEYTTSQLNLWPTRLETHEFTLSFRLLRVSSNSSGRIIIKHEVWPYPLHFCFRHNLTAAHSESNSSSGHQQTSNDLLCREIWNNLKGVVVRPGQRLTRS